jgi:hypothetical protein
VHTQRTMLIITKILSSFSRTRIITKIGNKKDMPISRE